MKVFGAQKCDEPLRIFGGGASEVKFSSFFHPCICSAGCGRTGAICAIDYTWNLLKTGVTLFIFPAYSISTLPFQELTLTNGLKFLFFFYREFLRILMSFS